MTAPIETQDTLTVRGSRTARCWAGALLILLATLAAYYPALRGEFIWDDQGWTTELETVYADAGGLWRIWTVPKTIQQYYPLTGTSFWLDYQLWGFWTLPYHIENVLLHVAAALLFWLLLHRLHVPGAWLAAAIFSLHPTMVESVGWITERKNVLSLLLTLAALLAYGRFESWWQTPHTRRGWPVYGIAFVLFLGALAAKVTAFVLPPVILLLAWWKAGAVQWRRDVLPLLPFFGAAVVFGLAAHWMERHHVGAVGADWDHTLAERVLVAGRAVWFYLGKFLYPVGVSFVYPQWDLDAASPAQWLYPTAAVAALLVVFLTRRRLGRGVVVALCCYIGPLVPVLGFMNLYGMRFTFVADRWAHYSMLPLAALAAAGLMRLQRRNRRVFLGIATAILCSLAALTWRHAGELRSSHTFWHSVLRGNPQCWLAIGELGVLEAKGGRYEEAIPFFQQAIALKPNFENAHANLGNAYAKLGRIEDAIAELRTAAQLEPHIALRQFHLGNALYLGQRMEEAAGAYREALKLDPSSYVVHEELANTLLRLGRTEEACSHFAEMQKLQPGNADPFTYMGNALLQSGRTREGIAQFELALQRDPDNKTALNNLSLTLVTAPDASVRDAPRALQLARKLDALSGGESPAYLSTLAAACAESGLFAEAYAAALKAAENAAAQGHHPFATSMREQAQRYKAQTQQ